MPLDQISTVDWNWFFSALAGSTATIVGLIGAFVFTKIVNNQVEFARARQRLRDLELTGQHLRDRADHRDFSWYNKLLRTAALEHAEALYKKKPSLAPKELLRKVILELSPYDNHEVVMKELLEKREEWREELQRPKARSPFGEIDLAALSNPNAYHQRRAQIEDAQGEREKIDILLVDTKHHVKRVEEECRSAMEEPYSPRIVEWTILTLGFLFAVGVIYPLSFLPLAPGQAIALGDLTLAPFFSRLFSLRGFLLLSFAVGMGTLLVVFFRIHRSLRFGETQRSRLQEMMKPEWYCEYFHGQPWPVEVPEPRQAVVSVENNRSTEPKGSP